MTKLDYGRLRSGIPSKPVTRLGLSVPAAIARGHRGYLDPNPRLIRSRTTVSRTEAPKGHRKFICR